MNTELKVSLFIFAICYMALKANGVARFIEQRKQPEVFDIFSFFVMAGTI